MEYTAHTSTILTTIVSVVSTDYSGRKRFHQVGIRLDGREGSWRVDIKTMSCLPWEAVDGGHGVANLRAAKALASRWLREARKRRTLTPSIEHARLRAA